MSFDSKCVVLGGNLDFALVGVPAGQTSEMAGVYLPRFQQIVDQVRPVGVGSEWNP